MAINLYDLSVPTFLQTTRALLTILDRASKHFADIGANPDKFVQARLYKDMAPLNFQIEAVWHHSVWGVEALKTGAFTPPPLEWPGSFTELQHIVEKAVVMLEGYIPTEVDSWSGKVLAIDIYQPVDMENPTTSCWAPQTLTFTPETYILTYALPNFYFHAVTAYDILRAQGVKIARADYQGRLRVQ